MERFHVFVCVCACRTSSWVSEWNRDSGRTRGRIEIRRAIDVVATAYPRRMTVANPGANSAKLAADDVNETVHAVRDQTKTEITFPGKMKALLISSFTFRFLSAFIRCLTERRLLIPESWT